MKRDPNQTAGLVEALTMFDRLVALIATRGGVLKDKNKVALDKSLAILARASEAIKMPPGVSVSPYTLPQE